MASLQDLIKNYISEVDNISDKNQAAREAVSKLKNLRYAESNTEIPKAELLRELHIIKGSANDRHLELIDAIAAKLEESNAE